MAKWQPNPFGGGTYKRLNRSMIAAIKTYCAIKQIPLAAFYVIQGSFNTGVAASAGTHDGPDVVDTLISVDEYTFKRIGVAAWSRWWKNNEHTHMVRLFAYGASWLAKRQWEEYIARGTDGTGSLNNPDLEKMPRYRNVKHLSGPTPKVYVVKKQTASYNEAGYVSRRSTLKPGHFIDNVCGIVQCNREKFLVTSVNRQPVFIPMKDCSVLDRYRGQVITGQRYRVTSTAPARPAPNAAVPAIPGWSLKKGHEFDASRRFGNFVRAKKSFRWLHVSHLERIK